MVAISVTLTLPDVRAKVQQCAVLALYAVYQTQLFRPRIQIRQTPEGLSALFALHAETSADPDGADVAEALRWLCAERCFNIAAAIDPRRLQAAEAAARVVPTPQLVWQTPNSSTLTGFPPAILLKAKWDNAWSHSVYT